MKITIKREDLLHSLQIIIGVVERRQTMPILANILMSTQNNILTMTASDLEVELISTITVDNADELSVTIPGRKLLDICRSLPADSIILLNHKENKVILTSGKSKFSLSCLPANEFPVIPNITGDHLVSISQPKLKQLIENTHFSMAQQDVRYYLNGLLLEIENNIFRAVATDGHRLAFSQDILNDTIISKSVIVPRKGCLLYTSPSPRDRTRSRMPSSA